LNSLNDAAAMLISFVQRLFGLKNKSLNRGVVAISASIWQTPTLRKEPCKLTVSGVKSLGMYPLEYPFTAMNIFDKKTTMLRKSLRSFLLLALAIPALCAVRQDSSPKNQSGKLTEAKLLTAQEAGKLLPDAVFFRGQSAPIQTRNSGGVQFAKGSLFLVALVDTSGYSSSVQEKYQAYLITETPITIENHRLEPGAYGCGFLANNNFIVMDIGGHDLFSVHSTKDADLRRPSPLQVLQSSGGSGYRLYAGRDYVNVMQAP